MNPLPSMLPFAFFLFFLILLPPYVVPFDPRYLNCSANRCGELEITYPFRRIGVEADYCGHPYYGVECEEGDNLSMMIGDQKYEVLDITKENQSLTIVKKDVLKSICDLQQISPFVTLDHLFSFTDDDLNVTLLSYCPMLEPSSELHEFNCSHDQGGDHFLDLTQPPPDFLPPSCHKKQVIPMLKLAALDLTNNKNTVEAAAEALEKGFEVKWTLNTTECLACLNSKGECGYNTTLGKFSCFCEDGAHQSTCSGPRQMEASSSRWKLKLGIAAGTAIFMLAVFFLITWYRRRRKQKQSSYLVSRSISSHYSSRTDFERGGGAYCGPPIFKYDELKDATNNFDPEKELGNGGFGTVFYGKLKDGRDVAVKRLYEHNYKRTEQFMNEVEILGSLYHPNLVCLYGCTSRTSHRLLLVYEYVSNGTVADHLHGDLAKPGSLPWSIRMNIAIETASALVYLHASGIVHRDIKTNNILLDENFKVKVADFGLSRLFPLNATHVSTAPQGTPGYMDPEYHECYQLTEKSDVYSFGVVLMELLSSLPAVDIMRHRHEINLSTMAVNKIQSDALHELVDQHLGFGSDYNTTKMIAAVAELGFLCLQNVKDTRPSMAEVLQALQNIQKEYSDADNLEKNDVHSDDVAMLKVDALALSPVSVAMQWVSSSECTTPNASG